jgi:intracellular multiplication protein IcmE
MNTSNTSNIYYKKYLKYKSKYLMGKIQIGGLLDCPIEEINSSKHKTIGDYLRVYNCTYEQIPPDLIKNLTYDYFLRTNDRHPKQITISLLKKRNFPSTHFKKYGFSPRIFKEKIYSISELIEGGYTIGELRQSFSSDEIVKSFSINELREGGFQLYELFNKGFELQNLKDGGYTYNDFNEEIPEHRRDEVIDGQDGSRYYDSRESLGKAFEILELREKGFTLQQIIDIKDEKDVKKVKFTVKHLGEAGFTSQELRKAGFTLQQLKEGGFELKRGGVTAQELREAGFTPQQINEEGFFLKECFTLEELRKIEFNEKQLSDAGFTLKEQGYTAHDLKDNYGRWPIKNQGFTAQELRKVKLTPQNLREGGFTAQELLNEGFSLRELKGAKFTQKELEALGFTYEEIIDVVTIEHLQGLKTPNKDIVKLFNINELREGGFTLYSLVKLGVELKKLKDGGYDYKEFKEANLGKPFEILDLREKGFTLQDLKDGGYDYKNFKEANLGKPFEILDLREKRLTLQQIIDIKDEKDVTKAKFTAQELREAGFTAQELREAGFTLQQLIEGGFTAEGL